MSHYRIAPLRKVSPGHNLPAKIRIATGERLFWGGSDPMMAIFLWGRRYFNKRKTYHFRDYLFPGGFFMGRDINVTPAATIASLNDRIHCCCCCRRPSSQAVPFSLSNNPCWPTRPHSVIIITSSIFVFISTFPFINSRTSRALLCMPATV